MTPCNSLILLSIFAILACAGAAYLLSSPTKAPENAGLRALGISFAQRYPQNLWPAFKLRYLTFFTFQTLLF
jgi:hypothetical protein